LRVYTAKRGNYTPSTSNVDIALTVPTANVAMVKEVRATGTAAASAINRQGMVRHTANGVTPSAITTVKQNANDPAAGTTAASTFGTPPTFAGQDFNDMGVNAFGGKASWQITDLREAFWLIGGIGAGGQEGSLTGKNGAGGGTQEGLVVFEEA